MPRERTGPDRYGIGQGMQSFVNVIAVNYLGAIAENQSTIVDRYVINDS